MVETLENGKGSSYEGLKQQEPDLEAGRPALDRNETLGTELRRRGLRITFQVRKPPGLVRSPSVDSASRASEPWSSGTLCCSRQLSDQLSWRLIAGRQLHGGQQVRDKASGQPR